MIARAVNPPEGIGEFGFNERRTQGVTRVRREIGGGAEDQVRTAHRMPQRQFRRM
ncbi:MAG: hypothetical protein BWX84_01420 [Verrucomicrobia bacterium ADurb.Bin118]|nr:MAG: hypothetical protein BWX84_01420 [Verrucomicrobia bacterium ADurb.Bin118]